MNSCTLKKISPWLVILCLAGAIPVWAEVATTSEETKSARPAKDIARDAGRKPAQVLTFLGVQPGMTAIDLIAASGYYTEVLSAAVGSKGTVYAQNNDYVLKMRNGANDKAMTKRLAGNRLPNVIRLDKGISDLGIEPASIDLGITALNFHDIYNGSGADAALGFLKAAFAALKPGGVLGIIDHQGKADSDNSKLHRIHSALVKQTATQAGFKIEAESDLLANPDDNHTKKVFSPKIRGKTDRFLLKLRKPG